MNTIQTETTSRVEEARDVPFSKLFPWVLLVSMMFLITYLDRAMFGPLLPALEKEFGISHARSTSFLFYMSIGYSISMFISGITSSKIRPRIMVGGAVLGSGIMLLGISAAGSITMLTGLFVLLGMTAGHYFNGGLSTIRSLVSPGQWGKAISVHEIGPNASFFFGPILAEVGASYFGWRGLTATMGWLTIAAGIFFLLFAKGGESPAAPISFKGFRQALKQPKLWLFTWLMGLAISGEFAPFSVLTLHMIEERALSPEFSAFLLSASRIGAPFAVICGGIVTARIGTRRTLYICVTVYALGMGMMAMPWLPVFITGMFVQPLLTAMLFPPIFGLMAEAFPAKEQPMYLAIGMPLASFMGVGLMSNILGLWGDLVSFSAGFVMMGVLVIISIPLLRLMPDSANES